MTRAFVCAVVCCCTSLAAQNLSPQDAAAWRSDLRLLARELPARHPALFLKVTQAQWDSAVASIDRRIPKLSRNRVLVELFRLVALVGDAHTNVQPDASVGQRYYPLELYGFEDGVYVRRADSAHAGLVGAKVLRIGRASADEATRAGRRAGRDPGGCRRSVGRRRRGTGGRGG